MILDKLLLMMIQETSKMFSGKMELPEIDFCINIPAILESVKGQGSIKNQGQGSSQRKSKLGCGYGSDNQDLGMIDEYESFLDAQDEIFGSVYDLTKDRGYACLVVTNNAYKNGRMWPLAFDTVNRLSRKRVPKDEQVWCQDGRKLHPFGIFSSCVGNRSHHYCLIFRKEN